MKWTHMGIPRCFHEHLSRLMIKPTKWHMRPAKTLISLGVCPAWSESLLSTWRKLWFVATHWVHSEDSDQTGWMPRLIYSEDSDQTGRMPRLIWVFAGHTCHFVSFVMRRLISWAQQLFKVVRSYKNNPEQNAGTSVGRKALTALKFHQNGGLAGSEQKLTNTPVADPEGVWGGGLL